MSRPVFWGACRRAFQIRGILPWNSPRLAAAAGHAVAVTNFLTKMFGPAVTRGNADIRGMLFAFLERASAPDGCIEMAGAVDDHCVILQGWGAPPGPSCEVVLIGSAVERCMPQLALFARSDLRGTAIGQTIVLPASAARDLAQIEAVVLLDRRGMRWRPMITDRRILSPQETVNHLRGALPTYQCDGATRAALQASLRPRFDGRFTLYDGGHPIRVALDSVVAGAGAGTYLTGWLYEPVCGRGRGAPVQHRRWIREAGRQLDAGSRGRTFQTLSAMMPSCPGRMLARTGMASRSTSIRLPRQRTAMRYTLMCHSGTGGAVSCR